MGNGDMAGDEVFLECLRFYGYHGVNPGERALGQRFVADVHVKADLQRAGQSDDLGDTVDYSSGLLDRLVISRTVVAANSFKSYVARSIFGSVACGSVRVSMCFSLR